MNVRTPKSIVVAVVMLNSPDFCRGALTTYTCINTQPVYDSYVVDIECNAYTVNCADSWQKEALPVTLAWKW